MTNITNDGVFWHLQEMLGSNNALTPCGCNNQSRSSYCFFHGGHFVTSHCSLKSIDGINFGDNDTSTEGTEGISTTFANIPNPATVHTFPAIITSVARLIPSTRDSLHPYKLSNLLLVTESLTLMAGIFSSPFLNILYKLCTPVVVSSDTPLIPANSSGCFS